MISYSKQSINDTDIEAVTRVLKSDYLTTGPEVPAFEAELCDYIGCTYSVAANSGSSSLDLAIRILDLPKGSEIITTPFTFVATTNCILNNGLIPIYADIELSTRNIDSIEIEDKISEKTKAIVCVDYAGHPCDMSKIMKIAKDHDLKVIEDAAHALGAKYKDRFVGSIADMTVFSFHPVKTITTGEGGALTTNNEEYYKTARILRNNGIDKTPDQREDYLYEVLFPGFNYKMSDIQAALGRSQLARIEEFIQARTDIASLYSRYFEDLLIGLPDSYGNIRHAWHLYSILIQRRDRMYHLLKERGINTNVHYIPIYKFPFYKNKLHLKERDFPVTEEVFESILSLPLYPDLKASDLIIIIKAVEELL